MATKRRNLFLYLALGCFVAIIGVFVNGYMGIYDTIRVTGGWWEQRIGPFWEHYRYAIPITEANWEASLHYRYEIDNRRLFTYSASIQASVWQGNEKIFDLFSEDRSIKPFDRVMVEWILDSEQLQAQGFSPGIYTVKIERKGVEREIRVSFHENRERENIIPPWPSPPPFP